jgi:hypothetical protein
MKKIGPRAAMRAARECRRIVDDYSRIIDENAARTFGEGFKTEWSLFIGTFGAYGTRRTNGKKLTKAHVLYIRGLSDALALVPRP